MSWSIGAEISSIVKKRKARGLDFIIDQLTNSIQNVVTGDSFTTEISVLTANDVSGVTKRNGWLFNWKAEIKVSVRPTPYCMSELEGFALPE